MDLTNLFCETEYVEGEKIARSLLRKSFTHTQSSSLVEVEVSWADDFTSAYVTVPYLHLVRVILSATTAGQLT